MGTEAEAGGMSGPRYVYFAYCRDLHRVKIGCSSDRLMDGMPDRHDRSEPRFIFGQCNAVSGVLLPEQPERHAERVPAGPAAGNHAVRNCDLVQLIDKFSTHIVPPIVHIGTSDETPRGFTTPFNSIPYDPHSSGNRTTSAPPLSPNGRGCAPTRLARQIRRAA